MGCDIHMFVERKNGDVWKLVPETEGIRRPYYKEVSDAKTKDYFNKKTWSPGRNYALFGILAGVRSTIFNPITEPRDLPPDVSDELKSEYIPWASDAHTPSYYTLSELLAYQNVGVPVPCYLDISQYKKYKKTGKVPNNYSYSPPVGVIAVSNEHMTRVMKMAAFLDEKEYYTQIEYNMPYKEVSHAFFVNIIEAMQKLSDNPDNVRCVFWFDN